jgi:hypothetical protein
MKYRCSSRQQSESQDPVLAAFGPYEEALSCFNSSAPVPIQVNWKINNLQTIVLPSKHS